MTLPNSAEPAALRVLLVDDGAHRVGQIQDELAQQGHVVVGVVDSAVALHDAVLRLRPDVVIVDADSPSRDTLEHLATLSAQLPRPVVVFAEDEADDPMRRAMAAGVSAYVVAGLQARRIAPVLRVAIARFEQEALLRRQLLEAQAALGARKQVERAKGILMRTRGIGEDEAYKLLRKLAMDRGSKLEQVADQVIAAADLLAPPG
ncbi:ANTAR domain-containing response regulator [Rubrivivax albus]|uniref:ANTAR domain-containing response regulator n=1 Tax=Rubrivivax albus TaxID=2499835 RepID=UPI0018EE9EB6|nr:ANTAR domain-containing protein [Rubrivivax albus]